MDLAGKSIGFAMTGSFYTFRSIIPKMKEIIKLGAKVIPIMSFNAYNLDTKFGKAQDFINEIEGINKNKIIHTVEMAEQIRS